MKLVTTQHILREYERLMRAMYKSPHIKTKPIGEDKYAELACDELKKSYTHTEAIKLMKGMMECSEWVDLERPLFYKAQVRKDLIAALEKHPAKAEAENLLEFIKKAAQFKMSWSHDDEGTEVRRFRMASRQQWEHLCKDKNAVILKRDGKIRVLYVEIIPKLTYAAENAKAKLGEEFWKDYKYWAIWFGFLTEGHYYFYLG